MAAENESLTEFEDKLRKLEALTLALEEGEVGLEESVRNFEAGMTLARDCEALLKRAELRVEKLLDTDELAPLDAKPETGASS